MNREICIQKFLITGKYIVFSPSRSVPFGRYASYDAALRRKVQVENSQRPQKLDRDQITKSDLNKMLKVARDKMAQSGRYKKDTETTQLQGNLM